MPETVFRVDQSKSMREQEVPGHNRWHPDIPAAASVRPGDVFRIECKDWTDGQVRNDDSANDIRDMVLDHNHMLSGPIHVERLGPLRRRARSVRQRRQRQRARRAPGAKFSIGDLHFAQGDGEISFCGAMEMGGYVDVHVDLIKDGVNKYKADMPIFQPGRHEPRYTEFVSFIGISVDEAGDQHYMNATIAYKRACLSAIEYLKQFGYTGEQAYLILCAAPIEGRVSGIVDIPNACCSLYLPTGIFDVDIRPTGDGPTLVDRGQCALAD